MADQKVSELTAVTNADLDAADLIMVSDISAAESKSLSVAEADKRWGYPIAEYSSAQTLDIGNKVVICDTASAGFTITLPVAASSANIKYKIIKKAGLTDFNKLVVSDGVTFSTTLFGASETIEVISDGTAWLVVSATPSDIMDWTITTNITATTAVGKVYFHRGIMKVSSGMVLPTAAGAAVNASIDMPTGITINTDNLANGTDTSNEGATNFGGQTTWFEAGVAWKFIQARYLTTTTFAFFVNTQTLGLNQLSNGDGIHFSGMKVPVS